MYSPPHALILFMDYFMPAVLCVAPACKNIVRDGGSRCEKHRKTAKKERVENRKITGRRNSKIYNTQRWKRLSIKKRTVTPFCENCEDHGVMKVADVVDHIVELEDGGEPYEWSNLKSLCHSCHNNKTADEARKRKREK